MPDNRRSDRIKLPQPLDARAGGAAAQLVDISPGGLQLQHSEPLPPRNERVAVRFDWNGDSLLLTCVVMWTGIHRLPRTTSERPILASGLRIEPAGSDAERLFARMYKELNGDPALPYIFCELMNDVWTQRPTALREQPNEGFTVSAAEEPAQVERLCAAYAGGDAETRKLIRTLAALSIKKHRDGTKKRHPSAGVGEQRSDD
jgi:hypothetical protein